jgi:lipopolysaccharide export system protein LptC
MNRLVAISAIDLPDASGYETGVRVNDSRLFRAAMRHSRRVRFLRVAVPVIATVLIGGAIVVTWFNPLRLLLPGDFSRLVISGTKITMQQPRIAGFTHDGRSYEFTASAAAQDFTKPDLVELKDVRAVVKMQDQGSTEITAPLGIYDTKSEMLKLQNDILIVSSNGDYEVRLQEATVDIRKGNAISEKQVDVKFSQGTIKASRLEIIEAGALVRFDGGVTMVVIPDNVAKRGSPAVKR